MASPTRKRKREVTDRTANLLAVVALFLRRRSRPVKANDAAAASGCSIRTAYRLLAAMLSAGLISGGGSGGYRLRQRPRK